MTLDEEAMRRVRRGAELLDSKPEIANWRTRIDVSRLDFVSSHRCILGQVFKGNPSGVPGFRYGTETVFPDLGENGIASYGFGAGYAFDSGMFVYSVNLIRAWAAYLQEKNEPLRTELLSRRIELGTQIEQYEVAVAHALERIRTSRARIRDLDRAIDALSELDRSNKGSTEDGEGNTEGTEED